jgi:uncharacterized protein with GYD domain
MPVTFAYFAGVTGFFWPEGREGAMATYVSLVNFTEEGARHIRHTTERAKGLVNAAANLGIKIKDIYWTMGAFDAVFIADAPDDETLTAFAMSMASLGNIRTQTLRAFSIVEMSQIVAKLPAADMTTTK